MQCNVVICKENIFCFVLLTCIFPFLVTRDQILFFNQKTYVSSFLTKINRDFGLPLLNFSGFLCDPQEPQESQEPQEPDGQSL